MISERAWMGRRRLLAVGAFTVVAATTGAWRLKTPAVGVADPACCAAPSLKATPAPLSPTIATPMAPPRGDAANYAGRNPTLWGSNLPGIEITVARQRRRPPHHCFDFRRVRRPSGLRGRRRCARRTRRPPDPGYRLSQRTMDPGQPPSNGQPGSQPAQYASKIMDHYTYLCR